MYINLIIYALSGITEMARGTATVLFSNAEISLLCPVAMQRDSAAFIYNLITMKGTVESYLYLIK